MASGTNLNCSQYSLHQPFLTSENLLQVLSPLQIKIVSIFFLSNKDLAPMLQNPHKNQYDTQNSRTRTLGFRSSLEMSGTNHACTDLT